ncbi:MAG: flagellar hook capping FlgD N-terminal domain-containing protein [Gemmatimonas sp.]
MISSVRTSMYSPMFDTAPTGNDAPDPVTGPAEPSTPRTSTPLTDSMGKDDFMKLLVAQLKNQDPLNPMDGKDMAAQLAQFSSVEQMMQLNTTVSAQSDAQNKMVTALEDLKNAQGTQGDNLASLIEGQMAVSTVGKIGVTTGDTVFVDRDGGGAITIDTGLTAGNGEVTVKDSKGNVVSTGSVTDVKAGLQSIDLRDISFNPPLKNGSYSYSVNVTAEGKDPAAAKTYTTGRITGLRYENGSPVLLVGDKLSVPFSQLIQIRG